MTAFEDAALGAIEVTVIKLKPYGQHNVDLVRASRGLCTHFPMPLQGTIDHTLSTLPSTEGLKILVDSIPTKENKSYRTPVDVPRVVAALVWLKEHNPLYREITIDRNPNFDNVVEEVEDSGDCPPASRKQSTANIVSEKLPPTPIIDLIDVCELNDADDSPVVEYWISEDQVQDQPCQLRIPMTSRICVLGESGDGRLDDYIINGAQQILAVQFRQAFAGWASTLGRFVNRSRFIRCIAAGQDGVQILHVPGHWITTCIFNGIVYLFDSLLANGSDVDEQLCQVYHHLALDGSLIVRTVSCQQQLDSQLCGVMAIVFAVEIASYGPPAAMRVQFVQHRMRRWLAECLEEKQFQPCPRQEGLLPASWTERLLPIATPVPCLIRLLDDAQHEQRAHLAANGTEQEQPDSDEEYAELGADTPEEQGYLLTQTVDLDVNIAHYGVQDQFDQLPKETDAELYQMRRVEGEPVRESDELLLDVKSYPTLFPKGHFGRNHPRDPKVQPAMYIRSRFRHQDPRFRRDQQFIFTTIYLMDLLAVQRGIYTTLRTANLLNDLTAGNVRRLLEQRDVVAERSLQSIFANCRGSAQYWSRQTAHLMAMDANAGPATFFLTLSCKEYQWDDVREALVLLNDDLPDVSLQRQGLLCLKDPMTVSNQFYDRFRALMRLVILDKDGPFGEVVYYFWRIEYQARGAPHMHMKLWSKGAPVIGEASEEKVIQFIEKAVTCRLPSSISSPTLYRLVIDNQLHSCRPYCQRKDKNSKSGWRCKFGFPRPVQLETTLNEVTRANRRKNGRVEKLYYLRRSSKERFINDYNGLLLYIW
uniref:ATP-dependent DNA helicase n=1 Tax=Plectus sambesii TaxID=2011161 RepID=A0A914XH25_9BILA